MILENKDITVSLSKEMVMNIKYFAKKRDLKPNQYIQKILEKILKNGIPNKDEKLITIPTKLINDFKNKCEEKNRKPNDVLKDELNKMIYIDNEFDSL